MINSHDSSIDEQYRSTISQFNILNLNILIGLSFLKQAVKPFNILSKPEEKCPMLFRELEVLRKTRLAR
ncbi:hypothetical protein [Candidatus Nitrosocosmicus sp. T]